MAQSLSAECTPLKIKYDSCFNAWLESYLSPEVVTSASKTTNTDDSKAQRTRKMAKEYEEKCGAAWKAYNACVSVRCCWNPRPWIGDDWLKMVCREQSRNTSWKSSSIKHARKTLWEKWRAIWIEPILLDAERQLNPRPAYTSVYTLDIFAVRTFVLSTEWQLSHLLPFERNLH